MCFKILRGELWFKLHRGELCFKILRGELCFEILRGELCFKLLRGELRLNSLEEDCVLKSLEENCVKGKLKSYAKKWEEIGANKFIFDVIKNGYKIPYINTPKTRVFKNNQSAIAEVDFVSSTIDDLIKSGSVIETNRQPRVVSPLSVTSNSSGKKRLILDLRYVNDHVYKEYVSFDDWREFQNFVNPNGFIYKFDLRKGYHHVDIFHEHQDFLGFSWSMNNKRKFYMFTVLPFGLSTAPNIFTKLLRVLVRRWHHQGIKISVFLDDGCGTAQTFEEALRDSNTVESLPVSYTHLTLPTKA